MQISNLNCVYLSSLVKKFNDMHNSYFIICSMLNLLDMEEHVDWDIFLKNVPAPTVMLDYEIHKLRL